MFPCFTLRQPALPLFPLPSLKPAALEGKDISRTQAEISLHWCISCAGQHSSKLTNESKGSEELAIQMGFYLTLDFSYSIRHMHWLQVKGWNMVQHLQWLYEFTLEIWEVLSFVIQSLGPETGQMGYITQPPLWSHWLQGYHIFWPDILLCHSHLSFARIKFICACLWILIKISPLLNVQWNIVWHLKTLLQRMCVFYS